MTEESLSLSESVSLSDNRTGAKVETVCPPLNETHIELNLNLMGCRPFLERRGLLQAQRMPGPRIDPRKYKAHWIPLEPPLSNAEDLDHLTGEPTPPDRGQTFHWPHPQREAPTD